VSIIVPGTFYTSMGAGAHKKLLVRVTNVGPNNMVRHHGCDKTGIKLTAVQETHADIFLERFQLFYD